MKTVSTLLILPRTARMLLVAAAFAVAASGNRAAAQVEEDAEDQPAQPAGVRLDAGRVKLMELERKKRQSVYKKHFEQLRFHAFGGDDDPREVLLRMVSLRIVALTLECALTEAQVKKLELAGKGDIKRFLDRLDDIARRLDDPAADEHVLRRVLADWKPIEINWKNEFLGPGSLLTKTLKTTLTPQQAAMREVAVTDQRRQHYEWSIAVATRWLQTNLVLSDRQSERLARLLVKETRPPRKFGNATDIPLVLFQVASLPEETIRPIFDEGQWEALKRWLDMYKAGAEGAKVLERLGFILEAGHGHAPPAPGASATTPKVKWRPTARTEGPLP
jgi:hypothetical protein